MIRNIVDILKNEGLIKQDGYMTYCTEKNGTKMIKRIQTKFCIYKVETEWSEEPLVESGTIGLSWCLSPLEKNLSDIVNITKKRVFLSVLQGIIANDKKPIDNIVHIWEEKKKGFTYVYGAIKV